MDTNQAMTIAGKYLVIYFPKKTAAILLLAAGFLFYAAIIFPSKR
jgi:hypothetical protein